MKYIFLDIDGVLNNSSTLDERTAPILLDDKNMKNLQHIVQTTDAKIVLVSSYKDSWVKFMLNGTGIIGRFLVMVFSKYGLSIFDKTESVDLFPERGLWIKEYIYDNEPEAFVIIDDSKSDYEREELTNYWIRPSFEEGGLTEELAQKAIEILNK